MTTRSHLGEDWLGQWNRVLRAHVRLDQFRPTLPKAGPERERALDDMWAFFQQAYALKYAVIKDGKKTKLQVGRFIDREPTMRLCRDVADGTKHHRLDASYRPANPHWTTTEETAVVISAEGSAEE